jgi:hypothetical protein
MYAVDYDCGLIIHVLIVSIVLYCLQLFVVWTNQCIFNNDMTYIIYLLPLFSTLTCLLFFLSIVHFLISMISMELIYLLYGQINAYLIMI